MDQKLDMKITFPWMQDCIALTRQRVKELQKILEEAISGMEVD